MEAQDRQEDGIPTPEVMAVLLDLARLSQHAESATSETSGGIAIVLLERLVAACDAQRGAILFTERRPAGPKHTFVSPLPSRKTLRTFALHGMSEEEAHTLVTASSAEDAAIQSPPGEPCWVICRLPISVPLAHQQDDRAELSIAGQSSQTFLPLYALLILGWDGKDERVCIAAAKKGQTILPLVADVAGSAMVNILLVERIHELEAIADRKSLRDMELLKAELLATVSHELRSPLASIKGYAATLLRHERRILREERHEFLLAITEASDRLADVIDRLLELSQLETGDINIELSAVNLAYLAREAITAAEQRLMAPEHADRPCPLALRLEDGRGMPTNEEPVIWADRHRLREVLDNLLENAIHYSPEGGAIEITIRPIFTPGHTIIPATQQAWQEMVEICVRDHGIGIPPAHLGRVFDRFHRVDTRLTREVNGIGLGLAICKRIIELHGGMIWAESEESLGSAFHVWLPVDTHM
jgi:signal transduction histidine kinase